MHILTGVRYTRDVTRVERYDRQALPRVRMTGAGALRIPASVARTGVQVYRSGSEEWGELRLPEDVFAPASLASLASVPVTIAHEGGMVTPANWRQYSHGHAADRATVADPWVQTDLVVSSREAIDRVQRGDLVELSGGYTCRAEPAKGYHDGRPYSFVQRDIRWNHVSLLPRGHARAGTDARLHLDSTTGLSIPLVATSFFTTQGRIMTIKFDAKTATAQVGDRTYKLAQPGEIDRCRRDLHSLLTGFRADMLDPEQAKAKLDEFMAHAVALVEGLAAFAEMIAEDVNAAPPTMEEMEAAVGAEVMDAAVAKRAQVVDKAARLGVETKGKTSSALMREVLTKRGVRCDGWDDAQVSDVYGRIPDTIETFDARDRQVAGSGSPGKDQTEFEAKRKASLKRRADAWKRKSA